MLPALLVLSAWPNSPSLEPPRVARAKGLYADPEAAKYFDGIGVHWYGGLNTHNLDNAHAIAPSKFLLATEACNCPGVIYQVRRLSFCLSSCLSSPPASPLIASPPRLSSLQLPFPCRTSRSSGGVAPSTSAWTFSRTCCTGAPAGWIGTSSLTRRVGPTISATGATPISSPTRRTKRATERS